MKLLYLVVAFLFSNRLNLDLWFHAIKITTFKSKKFTLISFMFTVYYAYANTYGQARFECLFTYAYKKKVLYS
jgi:hypothetical protein